MRRSLQHYILVLLILASVGAAISFFIIGNIGGALVGGLIGILYEIIDLHREP